MLLKNKKGIIFGVSNKFGIAYAIAKSLHEQGAEIAFTYANDVMKPRVEPLAKEMNAKLLIECDVTKEKDIENTFKEYKKIYNDCDFVIHSVAFANKEDLSGNFSDTSHEGWNLAMSVSAYSLVAITRHAKPLLNKHASIIALSYIGSEKYVPHYNIMGVAKAALEASVRYLANELGQNEIRVNALSAGPVKTLAAKGIAGFNILLNIDKYRSPYQRNVKLKEIGDTALYLVSDLSTGVNGETLHVDCGQHCVAISKEEATLISKIKD
ncbi:MAG: enoyl-ACP reductase [bacterium]